MPFTYKYPRPALTVDCVVFGLDEANLKVLLIQRELEPHGGAWALPGGFVHVDEDLDQAAMRELQEETGVDQAAERHVPGDPGEAVEPGRPSVGGRHGSMRANVQAAPKPLSMPTTAIPAAHDDNIARRAVTPRRPAP